MPSGSIPHGTQRPDSGKRHEKRQEIDHEEELQQEMQETLEKILQLTRKYMLLDALMRQLTGQPQTTFIAQLDVLWAINRAHWQGREREHERMEGTPL